MSQSAANNPAGQLWPPSVLVIPGTAPACAASDRVPPADALTLQNVEAHQETDIWWGSYSGWTMLPSFLVCVLLTGAITWFAFAVARPMAQAVILGAGGIVWLAQLARWSHRVFSVSYRLTNRRVFIDRGFLRPDRLQVELGGIIRAEADQDAFERLFGVGKVRLRFRDQGGETVVLAGVSDPWTAVKCIEEARTELAKAHQPEAPARDLAGASG